MIIKKAGSNRELLDFFKRKNWTIPEIAKFLGISEHFLHELADGIPKKLTTLQRKKWIKLYVDLHFVNKDEIMSFEKIR